MNSQRRLSLLIALALAGILVSCAPSAPATLGSGAPSAPVAATGAPNRPSTTGALPDFKHVFVIVLENEDYEDVIGNSKAPYINSLAKHYGLATNYYGIHHPSLPNYLALTGGSTFEISSDCTDCFVAQPNIVDQLEAHGKSWKAYMEGMPGPCFVGDAAPLYRQKHNPFIYYDSVRTNPARCARIVPFTQFETDLQAAAPPDYVWITPNMCNDGHDCPSSSGDAWLKTWVPRILDTPAWKDRGVLFITYDEADRRGLLAGGCCQAGNGGHVVTLVISPLVKPGYQSSVPYDHYSLLRTIENAWGMPELGGARCDCAPPMADFFESPAARQ